MSAKRLAAIMEEMAAKDPKGLMAQLLQRRLKYAVTHSGRAHRDEFYCVGLACWRWGLDFEVYRRDPTEAELADPGVLVFDVGRRHEPELMNFDHHQLPAGTPECALSLLARECEVELDGREVTVEDLWREAPWYKGVVLQDALGLPGLAKHLGLPSIPEELVSGIEIFCLQEFSVQEKVSLEWKTFARDMVAAKIRTAIDFRATLEQIRAAHELREVEGVGTIFWCPTMGPFAINQFIDRERLKVAATATKDPRNGGVCLYRLTDTLDFNRIKGEPEILFAHAGGYMAIVRPGTAWERLKGLIVAARGDCGI